MKWFAEAGIAVNFYEVHCKNTERDKQFNAFMADDKLAVCLSVAMLSEGVHGIDGVILLRDTTSPNLYWQQIGRVFSVDMDTVPIIYDLVANCESIMECNLKNDLLEAINKRDKDKKTDINDSVKSIKDGNLNDNDKKEITKDDIESFFVFDQVIDAVNAFKQIEDRSISDDWTKKDEDLMRQYYTSMGTKVKSMLSVYRSNTAIISKAQKLGLVCNQIKKWSKEEKAYLKENYGILSTNEIADKLCRSKASVITMASDLKLKKIYIYWSDFEIETLKKYYEAEGDNIVLRLPYKTKEQCKRKSLELGIKNVRTKTSKYKNVSWNKSSNRWMVSLKIEGKAKFFGYFIDEDEAGRVALEKAREFGKTI